MGCDKDSLMGKAKTTRASKAKQGINSLLPIGRQGFSQLQESRALSRVMVTWEDKHHHPEHFPLPPAAFFPQLYVLSMMPYSMEYPFGQSGSAVPAPPNSLCTRSPLAVGAV